MLAPMTPVPINPMLWRDVGGVTEQVCWREGRSSYFGGPDSARSIIEIGGFVGRRRSAAAMKW